MEKIFIVLLIMAFLVGTTGGEIDFRDFNPREVEIEENKITGNQNIEEKKVGNNDLVKIYNEEISGNASIDLSSDKGDIYLVFKEKITGNVKINAKSNRGNIYLKFEETIRGNPAITLNAPNGSIFFYNNVETVGNANISINAKNVEYRTGEPEALKDY